MIATVPVGFLVDHANAGDVLAATAASIDARFCVAMAGALVNPHNTPDALFCLADALDECGRHVRLVAEEPSLVRPTLAALRGLAAIARDRATLLVTP
jgi:hypothetical protein